MSEELPPGFAPRLVAFCEQLRGEGVAIGTSEILDAFEALDVVPWTEPADFREALASSIAKSQDDRRIFDLVFDRFFFRAAEAEALAQGIGEGERSEGGERLDVDELREAIRQAIADGQRRRDARPRPARDRRLRPSRRRLWSGRRRRAADPPHPRPAADRAEQRGRRPGDRPRGHQPLRAPPAPGAGAGADRAGRAACPLPGRSPSSTARCRPARRRISRPSTARSPSYAGAWPPSVTSSAGGASTRRSTCAGRCVHRWRQAAFRCASSTGPSARGGRSCTCSATSPPRSPRPASSSFPSCTRCTTRFERCAASSSSSGSPR